MITITTKMLERWQSLSVAQLSRSTNIVAGGETLRR